MSSTASIAAVAAVPRAAALDRSEVRRRFEERFSVERMARDYVELYDDVLRRSCDRRGCLEHQRQPVSGKRPDLR